MSLLIDSKLEKFDILSSILSSFIFVLDIGISFFEVLQDFG